MAIIALTMGDDGAVLQQTVGLPAATTIGGQSVAALGVVTSTSANALAVGPGGATHPAFNIDASASTAATGVDIVAAAAGSGVAVKALSSGTDEALTLDAKGAGTVTINGTATGRIILGASAHFKTIATPVAAAGAGGGVSGAAALGSGNTLLVSSDGATKGVKFLTTTIGALKFIINTSATACNLF